MNSKHKLKPKKNRQELIHKGEDECPLEYGSYSPFEAKQPFVLGKEMPSPDPEKLLAFVNQYVAENQEHQICFVLTQEYPLSPKSGVHLRAADRILFDLLDLHYELEIGYAVNLVWCQEDGEFRYEPDLEVTTYGDILAMKRFIADPYQTEDFTNMKQLKQKKPHCVVFIGNGARFHQTFQQSPGQGVVNEDKFFRNGIFVYVSSVLSVGPKK